VETLREALKQARDDCTELKALRTEMQSIHSKHDRETNALTHQISELEAQLEESNKRQLILKEERDEHALTLEVSEKDKQKQLAVHQQRHDEIHAQAQEEHLEFCLCN
jgi:hypothetical protein